MSCISGCSCRRENLLEADLQCKYGANFSCWIVTWRLISKGPKGIIWVSCRSTRENTVERVFHNGHVGTKNLDQLQYHMDDSIFM